MPRITKNAQSLRVDGSVASSSAETSPAIKITMESLMDAGLNGRGAYEICELVAALKGRGCTQVSIATLYGRGTGISAVAATIDVIGSGDLMMGLLRGGGSLMQDTSTKERKAAFQSLVRDMQTPPEGYGVIDVKAGTIRYFVGPFR